MTKKEIELWGEYKEYIKEHNKPYYKAFRKLCKEEANRTGFDKESYEADLKKWEESSWLYKLFTSKPGKILYYRYGGFGTLFEIRKLYLAIEHNKMDEPTWEGFLDWRLKESKNN